MIKNLVGVRIRAVRKQRNLTQQKLADMAGIPRATLASVERDDVNPSLSIVFKIANALGMLMDQLIESQTRRIQHVPFDTMHKVISGDGAYSAVTVSPVNAFHVTQLVFNLCAGGSYDGKPHPPGSEEYLHVLDGSVVLDLAGESVSLNVGDTACFHGNVRHRYSNPSKTMESRAVVTILEGVIHKA